MRYVNPLQTISRVGCKQISLLLVTIVGALLTACSSSGGNPVPTIGINVGPGVNFRGDIVALQFQANAKLLAGVGYDGVYRWNLATNSNEQTFADQSIYLGFAPGVPLVASTDRKTITTWDASTGKQVATWNAKPRHLDAQTNVFEVSALAITPDQQTLIAAYNKGSMLQAWNLATGEATTTFGAPAKTGSIVEIALSPDGQLLASNDFSGVVQVWEVVSGQQVQAFKESSLKYQPGKLAWSHDGRWLAASSGDKNGGSVLVWDTNSWAIVATHTSDEHQFAGLAFHPSANTLAIGTSSGLIELYDPASDEVTHTFNGHVERVTTLAWNADGSQLASGGKEQFVIIWDTRSLTEKQRLLFPLNVLR
ncbi:WD40 repeat domain-containing protein [Herpetosiphon llansteffanensis]|uniref:WD40 repeat domain-containing protein n=1 Tax=Herpetosiphon llansteffanensis TaxID=2094568 RepID=UPI000D7C8378|nr:WD40 repeat domain-containing protein [Herpetosiphon llansteffanensis]